MRAPTPTGAAELAVPVKADLEAALSRLSARVKGAVSRSTERKRQGLRAAARALPSADQLLALPRRRFDEAASRLGRALFANTEAKRLRFRGLRLSPAMLQRRVNEARTRFARDAARVAPATLLRRIETHRQALQLLGRRADQTIAATLERRSTRLAQAGRLAETLSHKSVLQRGFALIRDADDQPVKSAARISPGDVLSIEFADGRAGAVASGTEAPKPATRKPAAKPKPGSGEQGSLF